jgi:hypothetical protein
MANSLSPSGFSPVRRLDSAVWNDATVTSNIAYNNSNKIAFNDPVKLISSGFIDLMAVGGSTIFGIFKGCEYWDPVSQTYRFSLQWPAAAGLSSTEAVLARVMADPTVVMQVQVSGGPLVQADIGQNIDILTSTSGAPNGAGISTCALDFTTLATTATLPFRIVGIVQSGIGPLYNPAAANNWAEVILNTSALTNRTGI